MPDAERKSLALSLQNVYETLAISWPTVVDATLGRVTKAACDDRLERWASNIVANANVDLHVHGREHLVPGVTYVVMSNHQSLYDIPVLFHVIGKDLRMVTKTELFKVPVFGPAMAAAGFIEIDRSNRQRAIESLAVAQKKLAQGTHVWIAPEGTRSRTGALLPFKKGGFALALETKLPILPVTLRGTRDILRAKGVRSVHGARVDVTLHAPLDPAKYEALGMKPGREALMADVRAALESAL
jgi:1-acyl-sn-glycerol-3-phosphate acyltransferase